ncbi:response regulator transcription factor [Streptococcus acidominimus]|uniref:Response regulator n=1 Tax=Streptococcus acidominimus TaxID=1326 RepID=A0A1Q8EEV3_STRAI|nr:response regulator transcription factor [Streptococcus acidominimus]OLF50322.1 DNA-binding response regulator [Streptococcus acidominimus]SUN07006.1 response regulator [Streptococcus acidominimus]
MSKIQVLLVDDHEMVRLGLKSFLNLQADIEVIAEASDGQEGIDKALALRPDIIVMDLVMPQLSGVDATLEILKEWKEAAVLILTSYLDNEKIYPVLKAGAKGYMLKTSSAEEIVRAIRKVYRGELAIETEVEKKMEHQKRHPALHDDLTAREREILTLLAKGYDNQRIADESFISLKTVKTHVSNILSKLAVSDRTQAVVYAFQHGLVAQDSES